MKKMVENLKDPKKKSIIMLCCYGVFFIFVFIIIATGKTEENVNTYKDYSNTKKEIKIENQENSIVNNYEYLYKIMDNENMIEIEGTKTIDNEVFTIGSKNYYKKDNNVYLNDGTNEIVTNTVFNTELYSYKNMEGLFKDKIAKEKTLYEDKNIKEIYSISSKDYFDYMKEDKCKDIDCTNIFVDVIVNKNSKEQIEKININLTNYYKYNYKIEINYMNINNIKEVSTN